MPLYEMQLPDGRVMRAEAANEADAYAGAQMWYKENGGAPSPGTPPGAPALADDAGAPQPSTPPPTAPTGTPPGEGSTMRYLSDVAEKVGQGALANYGDEIAATAGSLFGLGPYIGGKSRKEILADIRARERAFDAEHPKTALGAEVAGAFMPGAGVGAGVARVVPWLSRAPAVVRGMIGAGTAAAPIGALSETGRLEGSHTPSEYGDAAGRGAGVAAGIGALTYGAGNAAARVVGPWANAAAQRLSERGIRLTPGELLGPNAKRLEDTLTAVPFVNRMVRNRQTEGLHDLNRVAVNDALQDLNMGVRGVRLQSRTALPPGVEAGHDAVQFAHDEIASAYRMAVPRLRGKVNQSLNLDAAAIRRRLPNSMHGAFDDAVQRHIRANADPATGEIVGAAMQRALGDLRDEAGALTRSGPHYERLLGRALSDMRERLATNARTHTPPDVMRKFTNTERAFANLVRVENAAAKVGAENGVFTPAQYHAAVTVSDRSSRRNAVARGQALGQELSGDAKSVMTRRISDSGTPERAAIAGLIGGVGFAIPKATALTMAALGLSQTRAAQRTFQAMATASPQTRAALRRAMERATVMVAPGAGTSAEQYAGTE